MTKKQQMRFPFYSLEDLLTSEKGFGLATATPAQRAICRILEGRPLGALAAEPTVVEVIGTSDEVKLNGPPKEAMVVAAVRSAKSMIAAALSIWASQTCDVSFVSRGEIPRYSIVSLSLDNAKVILGHLYGALKQDALEDLRFDAEALGEWADVIQKEARAAYVGNVFLRHSTGHPMEIRVVAGKRAGGSLVSRWSFGGSLDEAPRMVGAEEGVINYDDARRALLGRMLPGGLLFSIGSPWAPFGPIYNRVSKDFGRPTQRLVVMRGRGDQLNPFWWTKERALELKESDPTAYQTDYLAEFADIEETLFPQVVLDAIKRGDDSDIPYERGHEYHAAMDPATRGNAWTLTIGDCVRRLDSEGKPKNVKRIVLARQWQGSTANPLKPKTILREINDVLTTYGLDWAYTDQWAADALKELGHDMGLALIEEPWTAHNKVDAFLGLSMQAAQGLIELPNNVLVLQDLRLTKKRAKQDGVSIALVKTGDGRHCDYSPAIAKTLSRWIREDQPAVPELGEEGYEELREQRMIEFEERELRQRPWFEDGEAEPEDVEDDPWPRHPWDQQRGLLL